ncbi:MAG TPA: hypothetical protein VNM90_18150, partial [Haliangium sp.]|nr:hypothetical protein [Haliangium sp.]
MKTRIALALVGSLSVVASPDAGPARAERIQQIATHTPAYEQTVAEVANMVGDQDAWQLVQQKGLNILNVLWEDTGRYLGSSVGPNISDVTIEVQVNSESGEPRNYLMPVIRYPNFTDKTADIDIDQFFVRVGNHSQGRALETVSLRELLAHPTRYMSLPRKGRIKGGSLLARRDSHVLVSAQHAFLPIPQQGKATFYPVIFNYQSYKDNPAVLTILVTRQGTSMTIVDNSRDTVDDGGSWGQRLYFNKDGKRAPLTAERLQDVMQSGTTMNGESAASLGEDANMLMLIQVPLRIKERPQMAFDGFGDGYAADAQAPVPGSTGMARRGRGAREADIDRAVLGHGPTKGPYTELDGLTIDRDPRFPVRVTVQFYQATSNGVIDAENIAAMTAQIDRVYASADYVGSLVVPESARPRPTQWDGTSHAPQGMTWMDFPGLAERYHKYG